MDCGGYYPPEAMDFDHRDPATKKTSVGLMVGGGGPGKTYGRGEILEEILKCDVVCSNCHRIRTRVRRGLQKAQAAQEGPENTRVVSSDILSKIVRERASQAFKYPMAPIDNPISRPRRPRRWIVAC